MKLFNSTLVLILSIVISNGNAQNLVPNPSFEIHTGCPTGSSQISNAIPWQGVTTNSTDYFHVCGSGGVTVPRSGLSYQPSRTGGGYAGLWTINSFDYNYREYLQVKLNTALQSDSCYLVEFFCSPNGGCVWAIKNLGAFLSSNAVNDVGPGSSGLVLQHLPQVVSTTMLSDTVNWMKVSGYYKALGGEEYITIGNFTIDSLTDTLNVGGTYDGSYYYIEDVRVEKVSGCDTLTSMPELWNEMHFHLYPNPSNGSFILECNLGEQESAVLNIYDITGKILAAHKISNAIKQQNIDANNLHSGIYFYDIKVNGRSTKKGKVTIIK